VFKQKWTKIVETREGFSVELSGRAGIIYSKGNQTILVDSEMLTGRHSFVVYPQSIDKWDSGDAITEVERKEIAENIKRALNWKGVSVDIDWE
jgi:hypothetical protein